MTFAALLTAELLHCLFNHAISHRQTGLRSSMSPQRTCYFQRKILSPSCRRQCFHLSFKASTHSANYGTNCLQKETLVVYKDFEDLLTETPYVFDVDSLIGYTNFIYLEGLNHHDLKDDVFNHLLITTGQVLLKDCYLSDRFFQTLKLLYPGIQSLRIHEDSDDLSSLNLTSLLTDFPDLRHLFIYSLPSNWLAENLQFKSCTLETLELSFYHCAPFSKDDFDQFLVFLKSQRPGFRITIVISFLSTFDNFFSDFEYYFDRKLVRSSAEEMNGCTAVEIVCRSKCVASTWYVPADCENKCL